MLKILEYVLHANICYMLPIVTYNSSDFCSVECSTIFLNHLGGAASGGCLLEGDELPRAQHALCTAAVVSGNGLDSSTEACLPKSSCHVTSVFFPMLIIKQLKKFLWYNILYRAGNSFQCVTKICYMAAGKGPFNMAHIKRFY